MNKASARQQLHRNPGPGGETPQQKVARLRAAAAKARDVDVSGFDRLVMRGRVWADRAHRFTALSLIGITGKLYIILGSRSCCEQENELLRKRNRKNILEKQAKLYSPVVPLMGLISLIFYFGKLSFLAFC